MLRPCRRPLVCWMLVLFAVAALLGLAEPAAAAEGRLTGQVTDGAANPLAGVAVELIDPGAATVVGRGMTDDAGRYQVRASTGTYDVRVTPPASSGFATTVVGAFAVGTDSTLDVVLARSDAELVVLSGVARDRGGAPLPQPTSVHLYPTGAGLAPAASLTGRAATGCGSSVARPTS